MITRGIGFRPDTLSALFVANETLVRDVVLKAAVNALPTVAVRDTSRPLRSKMVDFEQRREAGIGRFISRDLLEKYDKRPLGEIVAANVPGVTVHRGNSGPEAWAASGRTVSSAKCALCKPSPYLLSQLRGIWSTELLLCLGGEMSIVSTKFCEAH